MEGDNMATFLELLKESVIVQGILTLMVVGACVYLWITNQPIPPDLASITLLVVGFYFGAKVQNIANKSTQAINRAAEAVQSSKV